METIRVSAVVRRLVGRRALSATATAASDAGDAAATPAPGDNEERRTKHGFTFFEVADKLEKGGKGMHLTRSLWARYPEPSYWTVTRVKFSKVRLRNEERRRPMAC